ncbi:hypothetical protein FNYG_11273 [Fusarium nygamai]|uniref:Uncharacterized protein n=1 Tax=Gibberella nygamai TaxID=42673 RepID=A0A2K0VZL8_GIBNY|nr:hypothetical protein FNYG_11273 [Fusarium nygamai]
MDWSTDVIEARLGILGQIHEALESTPSPGLLPFFENKLGKFTYPEHRRRNKENVEMMRRAESNLDSFWARADRYLYDRTKNMNESILMGLLKSPRVLQRTPEWVEPTKEKKKVVDIEQPLSTYFFGLSSDDRDTKASGRLSVKPAKAKLKTRGTTTQSTDTDEAPAEAMAEAALEDPKPVFKVDRRALKTFRILFYDPDVTSTPGEVAWNDFLHALTSVGLAAEKLYGSVWQFSHILSKLAEVFIFMSLIHIIKYPLSLLDAMDGGFTELMGGLGRNLYSTSKIMGAELLDRT